MSERRWTEAQRAAIEDEGGALLVSAAAGSGKTAVLVERAVRLITREENPMPADRLLILTFTNAAAEELRSRIGVRLEEAARAQGPGARLRQQRLRLRRAFIGTIDAFCLQLVREHFAALDLPPDIGLGDEGQWAQLAELALAETMEAMYADVDFAALSELYGRARSDLVTEAAVQGLYDFTRTLPHPERQLARFAALYESAAPVADTPWGAELLENARRALAAAGRQLRRGIAEAEGDPAGAGWAATLEGYRRAVEALAAAVEADDWDGAVALCRSLTLPAFKPARGGDEMVKARVFQIRDSVKKILEDLQQGCFACTQAEFEADLATAGPLVAALCRAAALYGEKAFAARLSERALDFADFEHLALRLLQGEGGGRTAVAQAVAGRYDAVMVDEYQDTNDLQDALYQCLAAPGGENLFYVGDVKQSIYRFRSANPGIFLAKKDGWAPYGAGGHPAVLSLGHNFRSGPAVIEGVNHSFGRLMSRSLGEVEYGAPPAGGLAGPGVDGQAVPATGEALIAGAARQLPGSFELWALESDSGDDEAAYVAGQIARMIAEGHLVEEDGRTRPCEAGDFCILLRAGARMPRFAEALAAQGIPVTSATAGALLQTPEVLPVAAALRAIDNPGDDVSLAAALLGPLFGFTPDEVTALRAVRPGGGLWGALCAKSGLPQSGEQIFPRIASGPTAREQWGAKGAAAWAAPAESEDGRCRWFVEEMAYYRLLAAEAGVGRLCEELLERTGYLSAVAAMEAGASRRDNLLRFAGWAAEAGAAGRGGLAGFVRLMNAGAGPAPPAARSLPGHVTLLTIHKSKGLEWPVVILADAGRSFNLRDLSERVQMHAQLGVGLALRSGYALYPTLPALAIRSRAAREALSEEMRILYVALTRAHQQVVVCFAHRDISKLVAARAAAVEDGAADPFLLARCRSMAEWMVSATLCHPVLGPALAGAAAAAEDVDERAGALALRVVRAPGGADSAGAAGVPAPGEDLAQGGRPGKGLAQGDTPAQGASSAARGGLAPTLSAAALPAAGASTYRLTAEPDPALLEAIRAQFAGAPARAALAAVPAKVSVSALAGGHGPALLKRPSFMYKAGLTAAERGTAQHAFFQYADFAAARADAAAEAARLVKLGMLGAEQAAALDLAGVRAFFAAPLARRVAAAKRVLREVDFITSIPAATMDPSLQGALGEEPVLVQGIADLVLVNEADAELVDYKTDHGVTAAELTERYAGQLALYKMAMQRRLGLPVVRLTIWSFSLGAEVAVEAE